MPEFPPTAEQLEALEKFRTGRSLAIEAGAGTGKTASLYLLAEDAAPRRGQYIAFNKAIVLDASARMPGNVNCSTAHSLAFRHTGKRFAHRLRSPRMKSLDIANRLRINPVTVTDWAGERKTLSSSYLGGLTMRAIVRFCQTADPEPTWRHVPYIPGLDAPHTPGPGGGRDIVTNGYASNREVARHIEPALQRAWLDLTSPGGSLPYRHDHYLKLAQIDGMRIGADFILFDEAQDANPVMTAIVAAQDHAQLVWVGDSQQQIYSFTGAINALAGVPADQRAFLTQSFRFGPAVADIANRCLDALGAELRLVGAGPDSTVGPVADPDVVLARTNAVAVQTVLGAQSAGRSVHLVGGGTEIVAFARAAERLMRGQNVEHPELACFDSWQEVRDYVSHDEQGGELRLLVKLVDDFGVPTILTALDRMIPEAEADLVVSTAHKSKGRQWGTVQLAEDFPDEPTGEELRLLYVAVTRAQHRLDIDAVTYLTPTVGGEAANVVAPDPEVTTPVAVPAAGQSAPQAPPSSAPDFLDEDAANLAVDAIEYLRGRDGEPPDREAALDALREAIELLEEGPAFVPDVREVRPRHRKGTP